MPEPIMMFEPLPEPVQSRLEARYEILRANDPAGRAAIDARAGEIRAVITGGGTGLQAEWFDKLPQLGLVAVNGVGTDKLDLGLAAERGIHVTTTPGILTADVADLGMALILAAMRFLGQGERLVRSGTWTKQNSLPLAHSLTGKRLGIVGLGQIGEAIGRRAEAFSMQVGFWNRSEKHVPGWERHESVLSLAQSSDVLVVALAATSETEAMIGSEVLSALGSGGFLINVARGSVIDEGALLEALEQGKIAGAGLDVFRNEPNVDRRFLLLDNVFLFPHQGSATRETRLAMAQLVLDNLDAFFAGTMPPTSVTATRFAPS